MSDPLDMADTHEEMLAAASREGESAREVERLQAQVAKLTALVDNIATAIEEGDITAAMRLATFGPFNIENREALREAGQ